ncbi:MAG: hypothetical protein K2W96_00580, partial [Gemmataceae bacterium]|nr:hypothetical protein [Gemmataceae bacterium]
VDVEEDAGTTHCIHANLLHRNLAMDEAAIGKLSRAALEAGRMSGTVSVLDLREMHQEALAHACRSTQEARGSGSACTAPECDPPLKGE